MPAKALGVFLQVFQAIQLCVALQHRPARFRGQCLKVKQAFDSHPFREEIGGLLRAGSQAGTRRPVRGRKPGRGAAIAEGFCCKSGLVCPAGGKIFASQNFLLTFSAFYSIIDKRRFCSRRKRGVRGLGAGRSFCKMQNGKKEGLLS